MRRLDYIIKEQDDGKTVQSVFSEVLCLSGYLVRRNKHIPNAVTLDGEAATVRTIVHTGQCLSILLSDVERTSSVKPMPGPLDIVYEDEDLVVLNKRAEDIVHPDHGHPWNTLGNYLLYYYDTKGDGSDFHPVQRLDNGTSGLLVVAKHSYAQDRLSRAMHSEKFERNYLALCCGSFPEESGTVDAPILRPDPRRIRRCVGEGGLPAVTGYKIYKRFNSFTAVELRLHTGRTHQIRVHMASIGHPLLGDTLYGAPEHEMLARPALHSWKLRFIHPVTGEKMNFTAPLPKDMSMLMSE